MTARIDMIGKRMNMARITKTERGKRDGTGPHKDSYQRQTNKTGTGKRQKTMIR